MATVRRSELGRPAGRPAAGGHARPPAEPRPTQIPLMRAEPEFLKAVPEGDHAVAAARPLVTRHELSIGHFEAVDLADEQPPPFGLLVLSGAVCRETVLGGHASAYLFGPGTIMQPWEQIAASLPWEPSWSCVLETTVVVLDGDFPRYLERWPALGELVRAQLSAQLQGALCQCALTGLSRVDDRIIALFWHLADVWGTVRRDGVVIRLPLTHRLIGRMVAAERATISLALSRLSHRGLLVKTGTRTWMLHPESQLALTGQPDLQR
jgi:hypothetical protein